MPSVDAPSMSPHAILAALDRAAKAPPHAEKAVIAPVVAREAAALIRSLLEQASGQVYLSEIFESGAANAG